MQSVICQRCGKRPATMHLTEVAASGSRAEMHLCATCIQQLDLHLEAGPPPIAAILAQAPQPQAAAAGGREAKGLVNGDCPHCGLPFADFEAGKRFGCALDYTVWEDAIASLLSGYHGHDRHVGRRPGSDNGSGQERSLRRASLDAALRTAISGEDYEQAARLRDELRRLEQP